MIRKFNKNKKTYHCGNFFAGMIPKEPEIQQTSSSGVSSISSPDSCWGALWAALLADEQVCSGCEPWRYEQGGKTDPVSTGCSSCPSSPERAAGEMAVGAAPALWRQGMEGGGQCFTTEHKKNSCLAWIAQKDPKVSLLSEPKTWHAVSKQGGMLSSVCKQHHNPALPPLTRPSSVGSLSLFGEYPPGN